MARYTVTPPCHRSATAAPATCRAPPTFPNSDPMPLRLFSKLPILSSPPPGPGSWKPAFPFLALGVDGSWVPHVSGINSLCASVPGLLHSASRPCRHPPGGVCPLSLGATACLSVYPRMHAWAVFHALAIVTNAVANRDVKIPSRLCFPFFWVRTSKRNCWTIG